MVLLASVIFSGWLFAATLGSWAYFASDFTLDPVLRRKA